MTDRRPSREDGSNAKAEAPNPSRRQAAFWSQEELASLALRMGHLQVLRVGFALAVLGSGLLAPTLVRVPSSRLVLPTVTYLGVALALEAVRAGSGRRGLPVILALVFLDGLYLEWAVYRSGWTESTLLVLVYVHLVAVTILTSWRTGLKLAAWHCLLLVAAGWGQANGLLSPVATGATLQGRPFLLTVVTIWAVAGGTATFSAANERELHRRKRHVEALARLASELDRAKDARTVADTLLDAVRDALGFRRALVIAASEGRFAVAGARGVPALTELPGGVDALVRRAWEERRPLLVPTVNLETSPQLAGLLRGARNVVVVPLVADDYPLGALVLEHASRLRSRVERRVLSVVGQFASYAAMALRNAWLLETITRISETDPLTGVANRRAFEHALERELSRAQRTGTELTLLLVDIDHFKAFNDRHGHQAGDEAVRAVAQALVSACRAFDTVARYGGEELAVILPMCPWSESLAAAERVRAAVAGLDVPGGLTVSVGVAIYPTHGADADSLVRAADEALYRSKAAGRNRVSLAGDLWGDEPQPGTGPGGPVPTSVPAGTGAVDRPSLRSDLERAVERGELAVRYQPIVDLETGTVSGFEALVRWRHPTRGVLSPADFLPLAEETGLIMAIDRWVLHRACRQVREWQERAPDLSVSVNFSGWELERPESVRAVADALRASGLPSERLIIEITEGVLIDNVEAALRWIQEIKLLGVQIAIDDFGSGYSSLRYLKHFPADILKIDRSFVEGVAETERDSRFARALVELAHTLRKTPVAEGVESPLQHIELRQLGCELAQGFLFGLPLEADQVEDLLGPAAGSALALSPGGLQASTGRGATCSPRGLSTPTPAVSAASRTPGYTRRPKA
ncbi:MAG TPA: bifunctional diguanylate cyclase/phosphodiesterase [Actinomycetota bacterium]|nr:bifunctional diguanylate cyclase/phosphodiesterase [Actinomycetota bacterium]